MWDKLTLSEGKIIGLEQFIHPPPNFWAKNFPFPIVGGWLVRPIPRGFGQYTGTGMLSQLGKGVKAAVRMKAGQRHDSKNLQKKLHLSYILKSDVLAFQQLKF